MVAKWDGWMGMCVYIKISRETCESGQQTISMLSTSFVSPKANDLMENFETTGQWREKGVLTFFHITNQVLLQHKVCERAQLTISNKLNLIWPFKGHWSFF